MCVLTTCVMFPISHESIFSVRFGPTWVNSVSDEECDNKCDKCPYKQHIGPRPTPQHRPTVLVSLLRSVVCFHEKNAEKTWKRREKDHPSPEQSWKSLIHYKKPSSHSPELQIWCIYTDGCSPDCLERAFKINKKYSKHQRTRTISVANCWFNFPGIAVILA